MNKQNKRTTSKKVIQCYVEEPLHSKLKFIAAHHDKSISQIVKELITSYTDKY